MLTSTRCWGALEFVQRLALELESRERGASVTAGISEALNTREKDELIREADLALIGAKRINQQAAIYSPDMHASVEASIAEDEHHTQTLANALALAVDAKDSYTRSHCQTVAQLSVVIAMELDIDRERLVRIRLAGLLHDVGKIGVPDSILQKPAPLTHDEYEQMKGHSVLGAAIVEAADMPVEAHWVRHHHERIDGTGYPDGRAGDEIPLESRIIHVADAFEAMTSDRPYRRAPGQRYAIEELRRHSGTQFDGDVVEALIRRLDATGGRRELQGLPALDAASPAAPVSQATTSELPRRTAGRTCDLRLDHLILRSSEPEATLDALGHAGLPVLSGVQPIAGGAMRSGLARAGPSDIEVLAFGAPAPAQVEGYGLGLTAPGDDLMQTAARLRERGPGDLEHCSESSGGGCAPGSVGGLAMRRTSGSMVVVTAYDFDVDTWRETAPAGPRVVEVEIGVGNRLARWEALGPLDGPRVLLDPGGPLACVG